MQKSDSASKSMLNTWDMLTCIYSKNVWKSWWPADTVTWSNFALLEKSWTPLVLTKHILKCYNQFWSWFCQF